MEMDICFDSDSDDERGLRELEELNAKIEAEKNQAQYTSSDPVAHCSMSTPRTKEMEISFNSVNSDILQQLNIHPTAYFTSSAPNTSEMDVSYDSDSDDDSDLRKLEELNAKIEAERKHTECLSVNPIAHSSASAPGTSMKQEFANINEAIACNKLVTEKLNRLETQLMEKLRECRQRLQELKNPPPLAEKHDKGFRYVNCGKPHFRDKDNFPAPDNEDTILMRASGMYDYSSITTVPGWTVKDKSNFFQEILKMSRNLRKNELNSRIAQLQREYKGKKKSTSYQKEMAFLTKEIERVNKKPMKDVALPIDQDYDWDAVANTLNRRHSAQEYRAFWKLFLHPSINKSCWTTPEHVALQRIAHAHNFQDWDTIAAELNTGRSGYQCFVYFRSNVSNSITGQKWSKDEELYLQRLIHFYRENDYIPWGKIAASMEGRTKVQVYNKYLRLSESRKGRFLPEEDAVILTCTKKLGSNFRAMTKYLPGRSATQIRTRYQVLESKKNNTSVVWTVEEDKKLIQIMANQDSSTNYSSIMEHFPGKDRVHIRARYVTLVKWMRKHPNRDISQAPRRGARRLGHGRAENNINEALQNLKSRIQTEVEKTKSKRVCKNSSESDIEAGIIAFLINEKNSEDEQRRADLCDGEKLALNENSDIPSTSPNSVDMYKLLVLLKAKLNKSKFQKSSLSEQYPDLLLDQQDCLVKVKSYSKKATIKTVVLDDKPDIWGERPLKKITHVFPPNYATITGCRKLMALALLKPEKRALHFNILARRNVLFKEQMELLIERFNTLFVWPLLLSNQSLDEVKRGIPTASNPCTCEPKLSNYRVNFANGFAIPKPIFIPKRDRVTDADKNIDLDKNVEEKDINIKDLYVGSDDFMFMD
ncbi:snRNA-activating protein complex subunit 4 [Hyposmocoma kahamanoa]|uniref:snRNA-activating protein complex subunit 4 n=1 Tax=Hyposmocoma kahamanoa TaxID=1477025 RepID=UPI000E6DA40C|nr:snRNA-activating protein complex subunit 4 [Hyposmocoma kahamanoa]